MRCMVLNTLLNMLIGSLLAVPAHAALAGNVANGSEAACQALAAQVQDAATRKRDGESPAAIRKALGEQAPPAALADPADQRYFSSRLAGALSFGSMVQMQPDKAAAFYLKQCRIGS